MKKLFYLIFLLSLCYFFPSTAISAEAGSQDELTFDYVVRPIPNHAHQQRSSSSGSTSDLSVIGVTEGSVGGVDSADSSCCECGSHTHYNMKTKKKYTHNHCWGSCC